MECIKNSLLAKARTFWSRLIERKLNSLKRGEAVQVVVPFGAVGLRRVDDEQPQLSEKALCLKCITNSLLAKARTFWSRLIERKLNSLERGEVVQVVVPFGVVGLRRVDDEQSGLPEKALCLECITNSLLAKTQTFWSLLIERKLNSQKKGEVVQVVAFGVAGLRSVDEEAQRGWP